MKSKKLVVEESIPGGVFYDSVEKLLQFNVISIEYSDNLSNPIFSFFGKKRMFFFYLTLKWRRCNKSGETACLTKDIFRPKINVLLSHFP